MNVHQLEWLKSIVKLMPQPLGRVLEIGSLDVNGTARDILIATTYTGIDLQDGKGVDIQMDAHNIFKKFGGEFFDVVVNMNMLEHDVNFWGTMDQVNKVLRYGGYQIFSAPTFNFPIHRYPKDYWRFGEDAVREVIMKGYRIVDYKQVFTKEVEGKPVNPVICTLGVKI
jgi:2-polyprenyl-3-methyl-5-hydroxy-6-metoxy-1,4-benzoquinol methylase